MAYSDYGGYAYKNGERVVERSDFTITPEGGVGTPGSYPGFAAAASGMQGEELKKFVSYPSHHVVLGDGPLYVGLHKQSYTTLYRGIEALDPLEFLAPECAEAITVWTDKDGKVHRWVESDWSIKNNRPIVYNVDGHTLEVQYVETDNFYQYARLTQADGVVWTGFSGYGVGAGLEDCGYGYSTDDCEQSLFDTFAAKSQGQA